MNPPQPAGYPPEFEVDTTAAAPVDELATLDRLHDLLTLREVLTQRTREAYKIQAQAEEEAHTLQRQNKKALETVVGIVDELRRLVEDARRNLAAAVEPEAAPAEPEPIPAEPAPSGWFGRFFGRRQPAEAPPTPACPEGAAAAPAPAAQEAGEWLNAFARLLSLALNKLENLEIHHVPLQAQDLKTLAFEGHPVKSWVAIKGRSEDGRLVVKEEIRGLWVLRQDKKVTPILKGEVVV